MNSKKHTIIFVIFSILSFLPLFYTYENLAISIGSVNTGEPAISINPEYFQRFKLYKLFRNDTPYTDIVNVINTLNLNVSFNLSNSGLLPVYIGGVRYRVYVNGIASLSGQILLGDNYRPGDDETIHLIIKIPVRNDTQFINQLFYFKGFLHIYIDGYAYLRIASIPAYKTFSFGFDVDIKRVLKSYIVGEKVRIPRGEPVVLSVEWIGEEGKISRVRRGETVYVSILLTSKYDDFEGTLTLYIYKDLVLFPDEIYKGRVYSLHIAEGEIKNLIFKFRAPEEFEINLVGFYVVITDEHGMFKWVMPVEYPPRLAISG